MVNVPLPLSCALQRSAGFRKDQETIYNSACVKKGFLGIGIETVKKS
jgi:hypothetical protein